MLRRFKRVDILYATLYAYYLLINQVLLSRYPICFSDIIKLK
jgi:hypothetical protein